MKAARPTALALASLAAVSALTVTTASATTPEPVPGVPAATAGSSPSVALSSGVPATDFNPVTALSRPSAQVDTLVAYSFGTRIEEGDDPDRGIVSPGPVNEELAASVVRALDGRDIPVYAQFEIAEVLTTRYGLEGVHVINPVKNPDGTVTYLSTDGVAAQVASEMGTAVSTATVGVIAFQDHLWRSTYTSRVNGLHAFALSDVEMPSEYDQLSGQEWTRSPEAYLPRDYAGRAALLARVNQENIRTVLGIW